MREEGSLRVSLLKAVVEAGGGRKKSAWNAPMRSSRELVFAVQPARCGGALSKFWIGSTHTPKEYPGPSAPTWRMAVLTKSMAVPCPRTVS